MQSWHPCLKQSQEQKTGSEDRPPCSFLCHSLAFLRGFWSVAVGCPCVGRNLPRCPYDPESQDTSWAEEGQERSPSRRWQQLPRSSVLRHGGWCVVREQWDVTESLLSDFFPCLFYPHKLWCWCAVAPGAVWNLPVCPQGLLGSFYRCASTTESWSPPKVLAADSYGSFQL